VQKRAISKILELEGGYADIRNDRGGKTLFGLSTRQFPELAQDIADKSLSVELAKDILSERYYKKVFGYKSIEDKFPWLMWLLFTGAVHGAGDNHLIVEIQKFLNSKRVAVLNVDGMLGENTFNALLMLEDSTEIYEYIQGRIDHLISRRVNSVGVDAIDDAIASRVLKEFEIAASFVESKRSTEVEITGVEDGYLHIKSGDLELFIRSCPNGQSDGSTSEGMERFKV
jgi:hypothetical protein